MADEASRALDDPRTEVTYALDLRYAGQSYELTVEVASPADLPPAAAAFHAQHEQRFAHADASAPVEVVNVRAVARVRSVTALPVPPPGPGAQSRGEVEVVAGGRAWPARVYAREDFRPGDRIPGPAIVTQMDTTTLVEPGWTGTSDDGGNLILERGS